MRWSFRSGQSVRVVLTPSSGDPDLYVWHPNWQTRRPWVSNQPGSEVDEVSFVAPTTGVYQIEVYGYTAADYRLDVSLGTSGALSVRPAGLRMSGKVERSQPVISPAIEPGYQVALPDLAGVVRPAAYRLYLPILLRSFGAGW